MLRDIALLPDADWDKGAVHINPMIWDIYRRHLTGVTYNAERIEPNPDTQHLRAVPETEIAPDFLRDAADRLTDAAAIFGDIETLQNQYRALAPDLAFLRTGVARYADRPLRLHDTALQVVRRLDLRMSQEECPDAHQDALIADFQAELLGTMRDLQQQDDRVGAAVSLRTKTAIESASAAQIDAIADGVIEAEVISEGDLKSELREDVETLKDPMATPEATRQALYRLCSRLLRISAEATNLPTELVKNVTIIAGGLGLAVTIVIRLIIGVP